MPIKYYYGNSIKQKTEKLHKRGLSGKKTTDKAMTTAPIETQPMTASLASSLMPVIERMDVDGPATPENSQGILDAGKSRIEEEQFEIIEHSENESPTDISKEGRETGQGHQDSAEKISVQKTQAAQVSQAIKYPQVQVSQQEVEQLRELPEQVKLLQSKVNELESEAQKRPASHKEKTKSSESSDLSSRDKRKLEKQIQILTDNKAQMEEQIHSLLINQEATLKYQADLETRYREACSHIHKEAKAREETELNLRSEIAATQGQFQKERERAQKFMKTMAEMQSADPLKLDNSFFKSAVEALRYDIKNWARNQRLVPTPPAQNMISSVVSRVVVGSRERGPNYEFLSSIVPNYFEYTERNTDFRWLLQAYVWKRLVEMIWHDDLWAGVRKALDDDDTEYKLAGGYRLMKGKLEPDEHSSKEYVTQYHEWRCSSARILEKRISKDRRARTVAIIRDNIVDPLIEASSPIPQDIEIEDLDSIIEAAMRLAASMAQQRASFIFELIPIEAYGRAEFLPNLMTDPWPAEQIDRRTHMRAVSLMLAPRLLKYGTSEGTEFGTCTQLLEAEVETRTVFRKLR